MQRFNIVFHHQPIVQSALASAHISLPSAASAQQQMRSFANVASTLPHADEPPL
jgi:hypothetical protein